MKVVFLSLPFGEREESEIREQMERMKTKFLTYMDKVLGEDTSSVEFVDNYDCELSADKEYRSNSCAFIGFAVEQIAQCDAILVGSKWASSKGCRTEIFVARTYGIKIYFEDAISKAIDEDTDDIYTPVVDIKYLRDGMEPLECHGNFIDLYTPDEVIIHPNESKLIGLGVAMKLPEGYWGQLVPRSSTFKKYHIIMANSFGVIDTSYCGDGDEWKFSAFNPTDEDARIPANARIAQFRIVKDIPFTLNTVDHLSDNNRGGFGSTGA